MKRSGSVAHFLALLTLLSVAVDVAGGPNPGVNREELRTPWNRKYVDWVPWSSAIATATREQKPIMMVIHKTWCATCRQVSEDFARSAEIELLSKYFVMADVEDDDEPSDKKYAAQGQYNPRILFLHPDGEVADIINESGDPAHLHFYPDMPSLVKSMIRALKVISGVTNLAEL